ncbi:hypothetical protein Rs2_51568 [Raphanus sativus]|nr:hypothetical protein Rs2_51568 [Raphanus sativus]
MESGGQVSARWQSCGQWKLGCLGLVLNPCGRQSFMVKGCVDKKFVVKRVVVRHQVARLMVSNLVVRRVVVRRIAVGRVVSRVVLSRVSGVVVRGIRPVEMAT